MSAESTPISAARFAAALPSLPLSNLHAKAAELYNSLSHLRDSNAQLAPFADPASAEYDQICAESIRENEVVMERMNERLEILKLEVEGRGSFWVWGALDEDKGAEISHEAVNGDDATHSSTEHVANGSNGAGVVQSVAESTTNGENGQQASQGQSGRLTDQELARRIMEQMSEDDGDDGQGMHL